MQIYDILNKKNAGANPALSYNLSRDTYGAYKMRQLNCYEFLGYMILA